MQFLISWHPQRSSKVELYLPNVAVHNVRKQVGQDGGVSEVCFLVIHVDCTLCMTISRLLFLSELVITGIHSC